MITLNNISKISQHNAQDRYCIFFVYNTQSKRAGRGGRSIFIFYRYLLEKDYRTLIDSKLKNCNSK